MRRPGLSRTRGKRSRAQSRRDVLALASDFLCAEARNYAEACDKEDEAGQVIGRRALRRAAVAFALVAAEQGLTEQEMEDFEAPAKRNTR